MIDAEGIVSADAQEIADGAADGLAGAGLSLFLLLHLLDHRDVFFLLVIAGGVLFLPGTVRLSGFFQRYHRIQQIPVIFLQGSLGLSISYICTFSELFDFFQIIHVLFLSCVCICAAVYVSQPSL